ncbi:cupin-like domain-containing protein [Wenzhouxiangella sp. EGI_FJ10305]|uniref:cupin-like domain-containing protein n=1 Tax=Wenzhouxiangella sp. EGI_FJ10305 TaxID=3243768 RepID=UPI0035DBC9DE
MVALTRVKQIENVDASTFQREYKQPARPVVIKRLTESWPAREKWTVQHLKERAGGVVVPLYDSKPSRDHKHQHAPAARMPLGEYMDLLEKGENDLRLFFFNFFNTIPDLKQDFEYPDVGLKFFKKLPVLFMGGKGSRVQLHFDIDLADIMLCHFGGPKRVMLFSPEQTPWLYRVPFSFSALFDARVDQPDYDKYPALKQVQGEVADLEHGDVLYIPPGFWHFVEYRDIGFSMSLRAFPRTPGNLARMLYNLLVLRTVDGVMRKTVGQPWNDRNERLARSKTDRRLEATAQR